MENNKYYTPLIEEFHIGFEFEVNNSNWKRIKLDVLMCGWDLPHLNTYIKENRIRVKYLDKEDIESLGWTYMELYHREAIQIGCQKSDDIKTFELENFNIVVINNNYNSLRIRRNNPTIFEGVIKNKSELKKLMKQLDIKW